MSKEIPFEKLFVSELNVRKNSHSEDMDESNLENLRDDIKINGLINPLSVRRKNDKYEIYAGQRRFNAISMLKWKTIPCIISEITDEQAEMISLSENIHRNKMNVEDKLNVFSKHFETYKDIKKLSETSSLNQSTIKSYLKINEKLNKNLIKNFDMKGDDKLTMELALELCEKLEKEKQEEVFEKIKKISRIGIKKKIIEKIVENPNNDINSIIEEEQINEMKNYKIDNEPWIPHPETKEKIIIPPKFYGQFYEIIKNDKSNK